MAPGIAYRSLDGWPYPATERRKPPTFRADWTSTKRLLLAEAEHLGADLVVIQFDVAAGAIRRDGQLRADTRPGEHPGAIVSFGSRFGPLTYATDRYAVTHPSAPLKSWQCNVRAIALSLEHLRGVDRHGVTRAGEQYRGWAAIEPPRANGVGFATATEAARWMCQQARLAAGPLTREHLAAAYRLAAKRLHPDAGGDRSTWDRLQHARELAEALP